MPVNVFFQITKHYAKPGVVPLDITPIFPDFEVSIAVKSWENQHISPRRKVWIENHFMKLSCILHKTYCQFREHDVAL